jgi:hypothetical protein
MRARNSTSLLAAEWSKMLDDPDVDQDALRLFLARFDPASYTKTPQPDGGDSL